MNLLIREQLYWLKRANYLHCLVLPKRLTGSLPATDNDRPGSFVSNFYLSFSFFYYQLSTIYRCIATEQTAIRWSDSLKNFAHSVSTVDAHYGIIHAIRLFTINGKYFCLTGARDRQIILWDLKPTINVYNEYLYLYIFIYLE